VAYGKTERWHFGRAISEERQGNHATPKPLALCERGIKSSCPENGLIIDFFGGSGSTLITAEQLSRKCRMIEISPEYCEVICKRWENLTGGERKKL